MAVYFYDRIKIIIKVKMCLKKKKIVIIVGRKEIIILPSITC